VASEVSAKDIWQALSQAAYECADPGIQFHDTINSWHTCPSAGPIRASNPCSEYMFLDDSACNLASINLIKFMDGDGNFNLPAYLQTIHIMIVAQDILVETAGYPTPAIRKNSLSYRPLGIGFCGLGAFLMRKGIPYDSAAGREWAGFLAAALGGQATLTSSEIAKEKGPFLGFKANRTRVLQILKKHHDATKKMTTKFLDHSEVKKIQALWQQARTEVQKRGLRNAQVTALAPTGTIGLVMDAETMGVEPEFSLMKTKKMAGGGVLHSRSQSVGVALSGLKYSSKEIEEAEEFLSQNGVLRGTSTLRPEHVAIFDCAHDISPEAHVQMMAALQPFISGAISKTVNLPTNTKPEKIAEIYKMAFDLKLKSISVYRDASKGDQPLKKARIECFQC
jgi:ribonucleoside-diphosphate reductase alpha chain